jgi:hypothetical protein
MPPPSPKGTRDRRRCPGASGPRRRAPPSFGTRTRARTTRASRPPAVAPSVAAMDASTCGTDGESSSRPGGARRRRFVLLRRRRAPGAAQRHSAHWPGPRRRLPLGHVRGAGATVLTTTVNSGAPFGSFVAPTRSRQ